jgi:hypothetical protein
MLSTSIAAIFSDTIPQRVWVQLKSTTIKDIGKLTLYCFIVESLVSNNYLMHGYHFDSNSYLFLLKSTSANGGVEAIESSWVHLQEIKVQIRRKDYLSFSNIDLT